MPEYRHVDGVTHHSEGRCQKCGGRLYEFPRGLNVNGQTTRLSCAQCDHVTDHADGTDIDARDVGSEATTPGGA